MRSEYGCAPSELRLLGDYCDQLNGLSDVKSILEAMVSAAMKSQSADMGSAMLYSRSRDGLYPVVWIGFPEEYLRTVAYLSRNAVELGRTPATCCAAVDDIHTDPRSPLFGDAAHAAGYRSVWSVPLRGPENAALGTLAVYFRKPRKAVNGRIALLELYAAAASFSIRIAQLSEQMQADRDLFAGANRDFEGKVRKAEERRRALIHIMGDMKEFNKRLGDQRKAMLHILGDYERDRSRLARQTERLHNSRRALMHLLQDSHESNLRLERSRKAMIHIMGDLRETTAEIQRREQQLRDKQEQLVQTGKLATLGELTTGVAHELNNPLNNIGLFLGNAIDMIELGHSDRRGILAELHNAMQQVRKATEIISHLRTFGRAAPVSRETVSINHTVERAVCLMHEQLRLRQINITSDLSLQNPNVTGNAIQLEQVFINLLTNARDAMAESERKEIRISTRLYDGTVEVSLCDTGPGIPTGLEQRIFDPFFTTKEVGAGTGLGLSITYGIIKDHHGSIQVINRPGQGATFTIQLPQATDETLERAVI